MNFRASCGITTFRSTSAPRGERTPDFMFKAFCFHYWRMLGMSWYSKIYGS